MNSKYPTRCEKHWLPTEVFWMTAEEYADEFVGTWEAIPKDRTDAFFARGVRRQVTNEMAHQSHLAMAELAIEFGSAIPVETVELHRLKLHDDKGYVRDGDFYIIPKHKTQHSPKAIAAGRVDGRTQHSPPSTASIAKASRCS